MRNLWKKSNLETILAEETKILKEIFYIILGILQFIFDLKIPLVAKEKW